MRTGRLSISRGHEIGSGSGPVPIAPVPWEGIPVGFVPSTESYPRLQALERLGRLREKDMLSPEEFALEKALILGSLEEAPSTAVPRPGPPLVSRVSKAWLLPLGLVVGLALSLIAQPRETLRFVQDAVRQLG
jgi:hypothetical protein